MNTKKLLSIVLVLTMILCLLCGCASKDEDNNDNKKETKEVETQPLQIERLSSIDVKWVSDKHYDNLELNDAGQVVSIEKLYDVIEWVYLENGLVSRVEITDKQDGNVGFESWEYENDIPVSSNRNLNDGFTYLRDSTFKSTLDSDGRVSVLEENITNTDPENDEKSTSVQIMNFTYNTDGSVAMVEVTIDGEMDHITKLTYNDNGNLITYSCTGDELGEYLRFDLTYETVEATGTEKELALTGFSEFFYWETFLCSML